MRLHQTIVDFSFSQICHGDNVKTLPILYSLKCCQNGVDCSLRFLQRIQNNINFSFIKITSKRNIKMTNKLVDILSLMYPCNIIIKLTSNEMILRSGKLQSKLVSIVRF